MPSDVPCPNPDCPHMNYLRRADDTGTQIILNAIGEVNIRLGRMESGLAKAASRVERHSGEIEALQAENKTRIDKKWVLIAAITGPIATWVMSAVGIFKVGK